MYVQSLVATHSGLTNRRGLEGAGFEPVSTAFSGAVHIWFLLMLSLLSSFFPGATIAVILLSVLDTVVAAIAFACTAVVDFFRCSVIYFPGTVIAFTMLLQLLLSLPLLMIKEKVVWNSPANGAD
jgi:hypothetical protein